MYSDAAVIRIGSGSPVKTPARKVKGEGEHMKRMLVRLLLVLAVGAMLFGSVGCETWKGMGRDLEKGSHAMQGEETEAAPKQ